ncbi:hypothetical protein ABZZ79_37030 [Streptomyces sp. NPDC006458]|uniref:hypothetical protein n=1 Tax=Streptomyces sp. NPDC006458 TaxID=3154302 RepID=UPI0033BF7A1B
MAPPCLDAKIVGSSSRRCATRAPTPVRGLRNVNGALFATLSTDDALFDRLAPLAR